MKFSIRDLMLVTMIVAVCTAWWLDRTRLQSENFQLKESLDSPRYITYYRGGYRVRMPVGDY